MPSVEDNMVVIRVIVNWEIREPLCNKCFRLEKKLVICHSHILTKSLSRRKKRELMSDSRTGLGHRVQNMSNMNAIE